LKDSVRKVSEICGISRNKLYQMFIKNDISSK
jgi:predicted DNA-binding transcriptional regulator AlpA